MTITSSRKFVLTMLVIFTIAGMTSLWQQANAQKVAKGKDVTENRKAQSDPSLYQRPKPKKPIQPSVSQQNRWQEDKVFLEQADSLYRTDRWEDVKIVKGNVKFRHGGMFMYCDSAYFYADKDAADCFGHVRMEQGDTLFIYADKLFYNGISQMARLRCGASEPKVRLINRKVKLTTDSLDYDLARRLGWYEVGGELRDEVNTLTSIYGEYSPETKDAEFYYDVVLTNRRDGYRLLTDTLYYNTATNLARVVSRSIIEGEKDTIHTYAGTYNTRSGVADLTSRSLIVHRDSANNVITIEGDSLIYEREARVSRAYSYKDPTKRSQPVVLIDTARHAMLYGGFVHYDDATRRSFATDYPLLVEYSRPDTIFLRADTIRTYVLKSRILPDSLNTLPKDSLEKLRAMAPHPGDSIREYYLAKAYNRARFFRKDLQGVADSITFVELDSMLYMHRKPVVWSDERQINGKIIEVHFNDSTADWAHLPDSGIMMEHVDEDFYNQISANDIKAFLENQTLRRMEAEGNVMTVFMPEEEDSTVNKFVTTESSFLTIDMKDGDIDKMKLWPEVSGVVRPIGEVRRSEKLLRGAVWRDAIRPRREWYGSTLRWADDLGELPEELEIYFATPEE